VQTSAHLFLQCTTFGSVWHFIYRWLGISTVISFVVVDHFNQFSFGGGYCKVQCSIL